MADTKISALTAVASVVGANEFAVNEAGTSKKASGTQISTFINANLSLGAALNVNSQQITSTGATDIELHSDNDLNIILGDAAGVDDLNIKDSADVTVASINSDGAITAVSYGGILEANLLDLSAVETVSGAWTFSTAPTTPSINLTANSNQIVLDSDAGAGVTTTLTDSATAARVLTFPDATDTLVGKDTTDTLTNKSGNVSMWTNDSNYAIKAGTTADSQIAVWTGTTSIEGAASLTFGGSDLTVYETVNDGNPQLRIGAVDAEEVHIQSVYDAGAQTLDYVLLQTDVASVTANKGLFRFNVDGTDILDIDDGGIDLDTGTAISINGTDVLSATTLGTAVVTSSLTTVGALDSGSITANFGAIDNGTSNITTGGILTIDVDGTAEAAAGSLTLGAGNDAGIFFDGVDLNVLTNGLGASGIILDAEDDTLEIKGSGVLQATFDTTGLNLVSGDVYKINATEVLSATTLGTAVVTSSLTSVGTIATGTWSATEIAVNKGGTGQTTYTNGQLLIGNTTGNTLAKATLTQGTGMTITNGTGSITLDVTDNYLLNTGDIGTGVYDFGGATSFEVPNGAGGTTVDAAGEVCIDTTTGTLNFYDGSVERALNPLLSKSIVIESPTATEDLTFFHTEDAITITIMRAVCVGTTPSVTWTIRHHTDRSNAGNEVVTSGSVTTSTTTGSDITTFNDATIPADSFVWIETTAQSGTVTNIGITLHYTMDP